MSGITYQTFYLALLAETYGRTGQTEEGLSVLAEALTIVDSTGERFYEAEIYRLKGELLLAQEIKNQKSKVKNSIIQIPNPKSQILDPQVEAEASFLKAMEIARRQQSKSFELRAAMSLVRLRQRQVSRHPTSTAQRELRVKLTEAHRMLLEIHNWFTEGFDTADLREAKALLAKLN
jgi:predicted ATPase